MSDILAVVDVHLGPHYIDLNERGTLICDIDGTVADLAHRRVYVATKPKNWPAFEKTMHLDTPIPYIISAVQRLYMHGWKVIMCSGRGKQNQIVTEDWLYNHNVPYHHIYMRAEKDYRKDSIVKSELLDRILADGHKPDLVFDDRNQVVEMWRERGLKCIQVAEGDF